MCVRVSVSIVEGEGVVFLRRCRDRVVRFIADGFARGFVLRCGAWQSSKIVSSDSSPTIIVAGDFSADNTTEIERDGIFQLRAYRALLSERATAVGFQMRVRCWLSSPPFSGSPVL